MKQDNLIEGGFHAPRDMLRARLLAVQAAVAGALVTLMLGTVAILVAITGAQAADGMSATSSDGTRAFLAVLLVTMAFGLGTATVAMAKATGKQVRPARNRDHHG
jgi:uncharacterized ion transporter superfamily protein YfcC